MWGRRDLEGRRLRRRSAVILLLLGLGALLLAGCEDAIERQLGASTAAAIERTYSVNHDPLLADWATEAGATLTSFSGRQQIPYHFKVLNTDMVNAFAAPWGYIYVTQGLLDFADTEDEVVAVIGHEIGHVVNRDAMHSFKQSLLFTLAAGLIGRESRTWGDVAAVGLGLLSLSYSRQDEFDADDSGTRLAYRAGYNPQGMTDFLQKLHEDKEKGRSASFLEVLFSTHPFTPDRITRQQGKDWVRLETPESAARVAQGHLRRGHYRQALQLLESAGAAAEEDPQLVLLRADALFGRGQWRQAREQYQVASTEAPARYPQLALTQLAALTVPEAAPPGPQEQTMAQALLRESSAIVQQAKGATAQAAKVRAGMEPGLSGVRSVHGAAQSTLTGLSTVQVQLPSDSETAVLRANAAAAQAAEAVYALDRFQDLNALSAQWTAGAAQALDTRLQQLSAGAGRGGTLDLVRKALLELDRAQQDLTVAAAAAETAVSPAREAQDLALQTAQVVKRIFDLRRDDAHLLFLVRDLTAATDQKAKSAQDKSRQARELSDRAAIRGMVATLQLVQAQASPTELPGLDRAVAHYLRATPAEVASLRDQGVGYGDQALLLAVSRTTGQSSLSLVPQAVAEGSTLDRVGLNRDQLNGLKVMLKFLTRAMAKEVELAGREALPL